MIIIMIETLVFTLIIDNTYYSSFFVCRCIFCIMFLWSTCASPYAYSILYLFYGPFISNIRKR